MILFNESDNNKVSLIREGYNIKQNTDTEYSVENLDTLYEYWKAYRYFKRVGIKNLIIYGQ